MCSVQTRQENVAYMFLVLVSRPFAYFRTIIDKGEGRQAVSTAETVMSHSFLVSSFGQRSIGEERANCCC